MHNEELENELLLYSYNELEETRRKKFTQHLENCKVCRTRLEELKNLSLLVRQNQKSPPQKVLESIYENIHQSRKSSLLGQFKKIFARKFYKPAIAFAGAVLVVVFFNVYQKPSLPKDLWFDDLYEQVEILKSDISSVDEYFASSDYIIYAKMSELDEMIGSMEITSI